jgi:hypothetical protein
MHYKVAELLRGQLQQRPARTFIRRVRNWRTTNAELNDTDNYLRNGRAQPARRAGNSAGMFTGFIRLPAGENLGPADRPGITVHSSLST